MGCRFAINPSYGLRATGSAQPHLAILAASPLPGYNYSMSMQIDATYRDGVIHPNQPLDLPNDTPVSVVVPAVKPPAALTREDIIAKRPKTPKISVEEFRERLEKYAVHVGSLPPDFSREDIYSDHD
jgi:predicted DNA-binding antitoxin AbrB/MazE fold protein